MLAAVRTVAALAVTLVAGCNPTFAPPVQTGHYGAPEPLERGRVEVGVGAIGASLPLRSEPGGTSGPLHAGLTVGLRDGLALEIGGTLFPETWGMASAGARLAGDLSRGVPRTSRSPLVLRLAGDLEAGLGVGVGGDLDAEDAGSAAEEARPWNERIAYGGYGGVGGSLWLGWLALFVRGRAQVAASTGIPPTVWLTVLVGAQAAIGPLRLFVACGYGSYMNEDDSGGGFVSELGLRLRMGR